MKENQPVLDRIRRQTEYQQLLRGIEEGVAFGRKLPNEVTGLCEGAQIATLAALILDYKEKNGKGAACHRTRRAPGQRGECRT